MSNLYSDQILDHYRQPRNHGLLDPHDASGEDINSLCGDLVRIDLRLDGLTITDIRFSGHGCAISQAATSLLTEQIKGIGLNDIDAITDLDLLDMLGVPISMSRQECALLGLRVLKRCVASVSA